MNAEGTGKQLEQKPPGRSATTREKISLWLEAEGRATMVDGIRRRFIENFSGE